jgi:hypothetical protein
MSVAIPFRLKRVPYPSQVPSCTTLPCLVARDGQNEPTNPDGEEGEESPASSFWWTILAERKSVIFLLFQLIELNSIQL